MLTAWMVLLAVVSTGVVGCLAAMAGQMYERRKWERRLVENVRARNAAAPDRAEIERLEGAIDAIAVELERLGEGQRFVTKILAASQRPETTPRSPVPGAVSNVRRPTS